VLFVRADHPAFKGKFQKNSFPLKKLARRSLPLGAEACTMRLIFGTIKTLFANVLHIYCRGLEPGNDGASHLVTTAS
jgi:hypothetical protein